MTNNDRTEEVLRSKWIILFWKVAKYARLNNLDHWISTHQPRMDYNTEDEGQDHMTWSS